MSVFLKFVKGTIETLLECQSARLGGKPEEALCLTVTHPIHRSYLSLGHKENGKFKTYWFPEQPMEMQPKRMDIEAWPILDQLSELTGSPQHREMVTAMAEAFARHGFDPRSGLGYLGEECDFDVVGLRPVGCGQFHAPKFKPRNSGNCPQLPLDRLWTHAPQQMARMCKAMFYGLVTDPATMDFNRFCSYDFDDRDRKPSLPQNAGHCAFDSVAARMIHWWASCYVRTGDAECLDWAQRMADKWQGVQHLQSGLIPNFFGAIATNPGAPMPPGEWCESHGATLTAVAWLDAAAELGVQEFQKPVDGVGEGFTPSRSGNREGVKPSPTFMRRPGGERLAVQLTMMANRLARGIARFIYDPERRIFRAHTRLDGRPYLGIARYTFHTQEEKDKAVQRDPGLARVAVYDGAGFFRNPPYWSHCAGLDIPCQLAQIAGRTGDVELVRHVRMLAETAMDEAGKLRSEFTEDDRWTFHASARYIKTFVLLFRATGERKCLDDARALADLELRFLARIERPDWWRMPERNAFLEALLMLHKEIA